MSTLIPSYTDAVLSFDFKETLASPTFTPPTDDEVNTFVERTLTLFKKSDAHFLILFGLGSGAYPLALAKALPEQARLVVCETDTCTARTFLANHPTWREEDSPTCVISDISLWAQFYLLAMVGASAENTTMALNPELPDTDRQQYRSVQQLFLNAKPHQAINSSYLSHVGVQAPDLSVGVILSPDEPNLDQFFSQFPDWIKEVVIIWDADAVPETEYRCAAPIRQFAHPLKDFADQRNRMLDECSCTWVLYLDGDERFNEDIWGLFTATMLIKRLEACYFPRMTLYPDENNSKVGYGLWPDLQLRLFKKTKDVRFTRSIHEKVTGIKGRVALALDAPILHYSRLHKSPEKLTAKLKRFDAAGNDTVKHLLNDDYPSIPRALFPEASFIMGALQMLLLEENPA